MLVARIGAKRNPHSFWLENLKDNLEDVGVVGVKMDLNRILIHSDGVDLFKLVLKYDQ